jgi:glutamate-5-semialdehyde dehydrogenase
MRTVGAGIDFAAYAREIATRARQAAAALAAASTEVKNAALTEMARAVEEGAAGLIDANRLDCAAAKRKGGSAPVLQRLSLDEKGVAEIRAGLRHVVSLPDPVGEVMGEWRTPNGLHISKVRVPIGVILVIYEARPNVTPEAAALCIKSGNAVILRGGSEAICTNRAMAVLLQEAASRAGIPAASLQLVEHAEHEVVNELLKLNALIDLVIPRGGEALIRAVTELSAIPVIKHYKGVCHIYVDRGADFDMAERIVLNAKVQKPAVCNAAEALLVHEGIAAAFLPRIAARLREKGVELRGDERSRAVVRGMKAAAESDWGCEFLDLILAVKVVTSLDEAVAHIARYGSQHSDAIVTGDRAAAERFLREVDSSAVFWNASTRFNDGGQFGMGAEIGISTDRIHARGPMALPELTIYKYVVRGTGQVRE